MDSVATISPDPNMAPHLVWESISDWAETFGVRNFQTIAAAFNLAIESSWGLNGARDKILATVAAVLPGDSVRLEDRDTLVAWSMITAMAPQAVSVCLDCRAFLPGFPREVPPPSDAARWHDLAELHMPGCTFVATRGFSGDITAAISGTSADRSHPIQPPAP